MEEQAQTKSAPISTTRSKIFFKIVSLMVVVSVLPISSLAFFLNRMSENSVRHSVSAGFLIIAQKTANEILTFINGTETALQLTAQVIAQFPEDEKGLKTIMERQTRLLQGVERIYLIDKNGRDTLGPGKQDFSEAEFFNKGMESDIYYSKIEPSNRIAPTMKICMPVRREGKTTALLVFDLAVKHLWELTESIKIGETGRAYIVDRQGTVIAHPQTERVLRKEKLRGIPIVKNLLEGINTTEEYVNENGVPVLGAATLVPKLHWGVVVEQSVVEAFALVNEIQRLTFILLVIAIYFAITIGFLRTVKIVSPIQKLIEGVRRVARGDLSCSISVESRDEIGALAEDFNKMTVSLREAKKNEQLAILGRLTSTIAHEIKNPLEAIKGASIYLKNKYTDIEPIQKFTKIIVQEVDHLANFISVILSSVKKVELHLTPTNVNAVIENLCQLLDQDLRFEKVRLTTDLDRIIPPCPLDAEHLQMAFLNLAINAMQAMSRGGELHIETAYRPGPESYIEIKFRDNGTGIPENIKKAIFQPFTSSKRTGTGLGLSYCHEIITRHQGKIEVYSSLNKGTVFTIKLPVRKQGHDEYPGQLDAPADTLT